jgi:hypothetical protein
MENDRGRASTDGIVICPVCRQPVMALFGLVTTHVDAQLVACAGSLTVASQRLGGKEDQ